MSEMTDPVDLDELIPELFLVPNTDPPIYNIKNIITNPMPFIPIIKGLKSGKRVEVIEHILGMFSKCYHNRLIVNDPMAYGKYNIDLVKLCISAYYSDFAKTDQATREVLLKLIKEITIGGRYNKSHFETIYSYIARHPEDLYGSLELIEQMISVDNSHIPMFYFSDYESYIEINPLLTTEKAFMGGFGFAIWFRLEYLNGHQTGPEHSTLFSIYSNGHGGFEAYFENNTLYYKTLSGKGYVHGHDSKSEMVYEFHTEQWYMFYVAHSNKYLASDVKFIVNGETVKEVSMKYPKMDKVGKLDRGYICKNFTGQVSSIIIFNEYIKSSVITELLSKFPKEIHPERFMDEIENDSKLKELKISEKIFSIYLPSRAQRTANSTDIYIDFNSSTNKGRLGPLSGVFSQDRQKNQFLF